MEIVWGDCGTWSLDEMNILNQNYGEEKVWKHSFSGPGETLQNRYFAFTCEK